MSGRAYFWSSAGALLATLAFDLVPRGTTTLNTATVPALASQDGSLTVAHDGGYGALAGKTIALEPARGYSFDSPLVARPR